MRYKILKGGVQINVIESTPEFCAEYCAANGYTYQEAPLPETPAPEPEPTLDDRVSTLEATKADQTDVDELNEALDMILTGYTGEEAADETGT